MGVPSRFFPLQSKTHTYPGQEKMWIHSQNSPREENEPILCDSLGLFFKLDILHIQNSQAFKLYLHIITITVFLSDVPKKLHLLSAVKLLSNFWLQQISSHIYSFWKS